MASSEHNADPDTGISYNESPNAIQRLLDKLKKRPPQGGMMPVLDNSNNLMQNSIASLNAKLEDLVNFKELSKSETKRRNGEKGATRSRIADAASGALVAGGVGSISGGISGLIKAGKPIGSSGSTKWYDPFKKFRPGSGEGNGHTDYGSTLGIRHPGDEMQDIGGEEWKVRPGDHEHPGEAFRKGPLTESEKAARVGLTKEFKKAKLITRRIGVGGAIGATVGSLPFLLKKPYPKGAGRETEGKKLGIGPGVYTGLLGGAAAGAKFLPHSPTGIAAGALGGGIVGSLIGSRFGGAIGSRIRRSNRRQTSDAKLLSSKITDMVNFEYMEPVLGQWSKPVMHKKNEKELSSLLDELIEFAYDPAADKWKKLYMSKVSRLQAAQEYDKVRGVKSVGNSPLGLAVRKKQNALKAYKNLTPHIEDIAKALENFHFSARLDKLIQFQEDPRPRNPLGEFSGEQDGGPDPNAMVKTYRIAPAQSGIAPNSGESQNPGLKQAAGVALLGGALGSAGGAAGKHGYHALHKLIGRISKKGPSKIIRP